jgi:hypothetical protein
MGSSLIATGDIVEGRGHLDRAMALHDPAARSGRSSAYGSIPLGNVANVLIYRSLALWLLGYPNAGLVDADKAISGAREIREAGTLMPALCFGSLTYIHCGNYPTAKALLDEIDALADEKKLRALESIRHDEPRIFIGSYRWQSIGRCPQDRFWNYCLAINWSYTLDADVSVISSEGSR